MSEEQKTESTIVEELNKLGQQVADTIRAAWESDDRVKLQDEISEGMKQFGDQISEAVDKASDSETAKQLRERAEQVVEDVRESDVTEDIRKGLLAGLDAINRELGKLLERLDVKSEDKVEVEAEPSPETEGTEQA